MKYIVIFYMMIVSSFMFAQSNSDSLIFTSKREASNHIFSLLTPSLYNNALLNKSNSTLPLLYQQIQGEYNHVMTTEDWLLLYSDITLSYSDTTVIPTMSEMATKITSFFFFHDANYSELIQPFGLILNNISLIDTSHLNSQDLDIVNGKIIPKINETNLYSKVLLKSASLIEFYPDNGYEYGKLKYDPNFIITSDDIQLTSIRIDVMDGNNFQDFNENNPFIQYDRIKDSIIAKAAIQYLKNDITVYDTIRFYLTTKSNLNNNKAASETWDIVGTVDPLPGNDLTYEVGIKFGCGNENIDVFGGKVIRRPIIISNAYRPILQSFSMDKYWSQFNIGVNIGGLFSSLSALGYDVIFIKDEPGNVSLEVAGSELAEYIKDVNELKKNNFPNEDWETIVIGYSMGGQKARYALLKLEKEHMENGGPHPHTRLFIPFDSPHHSANIPLFTQATYKTFKSSNIVALLANLSFIDPASRDMGLYSIYNSQELSSSGIFKKDLIPKPDQAEVNYQYELHNNFQHYYTHHSDTRKTFPSFSRNIGISMGSYNKDYNNEWGLFPGMTLFSQNTLGNLFIPLLGMNIGTVSRKIYASKYSTTTPQISFKRNDVYLILGVSPFYLRNEYNFQNGYEWDMAQGGSKTLFYDGTNGGATSILKSQTLGAGVKNYTKEVSFMPLVSSLAINPSIWQNNNLYFNLQDEGLMYQIYNFNPLSDKSNIFGYPHLANPSNHFNITPFEAVYADNFHWEHIVMSNTLANYDEEVNQSYLNDLRTFIINEVEASIFPLQNKIIGENHAFDPNFEYKAWYKARDKIVIGNKVTPTTNPGDYIIKESGNITVYACNSVNIKSGFHSMNGSTFHAFIQCPITCDNNSGKTNTKKTTLNIHHDKKINSNKHIERKVKKIQLFPNPNNGSFKFIVNETNPSGELFVYGMNGTLFYRQRITQNESQLQLTLKKGIYILVYRTNNKVETVKLIIN